MNQFEILVNDYQKNHGYSLHDACLVVERSHPKVAKDYLQKTGERAAESRAAAIWAAKSPEEQFQGSAELQAEFGDLDIYKAYLAAQEAGQVKQMVGSFCPQNMGKKIAG